MSRMRGSTARIRSVLALLVIAALTLGFSATAATAVGTASISGTVRDSAGAPLAGVSVQLFDAETGYTYFGASDVTDVNGEYSIAGLHADAYKLAFVKSGHAVQWWERKARPEYADAILLGDYEHLVSYDATLSRAGGLAGTIVADTGVTAALDAKVTLYSASGGYVDDVGVDSSDPGYPGFEFADLQPGSYILEVRFDDEALIDDWYDRKESYGQANVVNVAAETTPSVTLIARAGATISGRVTNETTGFPDVDVSVINTANTVSKWVSPDADGNYEIEGLPSGEYRVFASADDESYVSEYYDDETLEWDAELVAVAGTEVESGIDFKLEKGSSVEGTVTGPNGAKLPFVDVEIMGTTEDGQEFYEEGRTGMDGRYRLKGVPNGEYTVFFSAEGLNRSNITSLAPTGLVSEYWDDQIVWANADVIELAEPTATENVDAALSAGGAIKGTVRGRDGQPLSGIQVRAFLRSDSEYFYQVAMVQTSPDGTYEFKGLAPGPYVVQFGYDDNPNDADPDDNFYANGARTFASATKVAVAGGQTASGVDGVVTVDTGRLSGRVVGPDGKPVWGVRAVFSRETPSGWVEEPGDFDDTSEEGRFYTRGVGNVRVRFTDATKRYADAAGPTVNLEPGRTTEVTYTLQYLPADSAQGADRFATSVEISKRAFPNGAWSVIIATGRNWPDALGGSGLAAAAEGAPILLVEKDSIPEVVAHELSRLDNKGWIRRVYILGGPTVISERVEQQLSGMFDWPNGERGVHRLAGATRYDTAMRIAGEIVDLQGVGYDGTAFVATGLNYPDALAASPLAAAKGWPLFLTPATGVSSAMADAMAAKGVKKVIMLGSTSALPADTVETPLKAKFGADNVKRLAGGTRYATAIEIAKFGVSEGLGWNGVGFATGTNFPDALAGGILQASQGSVMLLTPGTSLDPGVEALIKQKKSEIYSVRFFGGPAAISQAVRDKVAAARR